MKLTRKMIPAFAMLVLSAVLMSTASFAWFSMNGDVSVSGFSVEATAPAALWISESGDPGTYTTQITLNTAAKDIAPVTNKFTDARNNSAANAATWTFQSLDTDVYKTVQEDGKVGQKGAEVTEDVLVNDTTNFLKDDFFLLLEGQRDAAGVEQKVVSAAVTIDCASPSAATEIVWKSLRIAIVTAGGTKGDSYVASTEGKAIFAPTANQALGDKMDSQVITTIAAQDPVHLYVYIWFEGEDDENYNRAAQFMDDYSISIDFSATAHTHTFDEGETNCNVCGAACAHTYGTDNKCTACGATKPTEEPTT